MKICILFNIPIQQTVKYSDWHDGFVKAINILISKGYIIHFYNSSDNKNINFNDYDLVFFKEGFCGNIYKKYKTSLVKKNILGLFISSSYHIPTNKELEIYNILFYETYWYYEYAQLNRHPNTYHAFGIDNEIMKPKNLDKIYDVIFVGNICNYKRPLNLLDLSGNKICIGFKTDNNIIKILEENKVEIKEFITYKELSNYYNMSKICYIPCQLHGGGERAVLEARSCGLPVKIENDNPKLKELCESEIYTSKYYSDQIEKAIWNIIYNNINSLSYNDILEYFKDFKFDI